MTCKLTLASGGRSGAAPPCHPPAMPINAVTYFEGLGRMERTGSNLSCDGKGFGWGCVVYLCDGLEEPAKKHTASDDLCGGERERDREKGEDEVGVRDGRGNE